MRLKLRSLMVAIVFLALLTAVCVQTVRLREAAVREQQLRAELERQRLAAMVRHLDALVAKAARDQAAKRPER